MLKNYILIANAYMKFIIGKNYRRVVTLPARLEGSLSIVGNKES
jgi:hypothetical protein